MNDLNGILPDQKKKQEKYDEFFNKQPKSDIIPTEDPYLFDDLCSDRLVKEWKMYGQLIVAYDYDNTVFDYNKRGYKFDKIINLLRECSKLGFHLVVFTSCDESRFPEIKEYLNINNVPFNSINEVPDFIPFKGRKVYYNILLDDRSGLSAAYNILWTVIYSIRGLKHSQGLDDVN